MSGSPLSRGRGRKLRKAGRRGNSPVAVGTGPQGSARVVDLRIADDLKSNVGL